MVVYSQIFLACLTPRTTWPRTDRELNMRDLIWYDRHLFGFGNRLKGENRVKDKIAESLAVKGAPWTRPCS
jgi:hypothetical protein